MNSSNKEDYLKVNFDPAEIPVVKTEKNYEDDNYLQYEYLEDELMNSDNESVKSNGSSFSVDAGIRKKPSAKITSNDDATVTSDDSISSCDDDESDDSDDSNFSVDAGKKKQSAITSSNGIRTTLKCYKRTINKTGCIFEDCDLKDTTLISNIVRIKVLKEYKLYILKSSEACSIHARDQNWDELLKCTYNDFTPTDIVDILELLKQSSHACIDFEMIENIPTRLIRYWLNVNKVQFQRIFDRFPVLLTLESPKTSLSVYLMNLQNNDAERIALLLQVSEASVIDKIKSVQTIIPCKSYNELNKMFKLEY